MRKTNKFSSRGACAKKLRLGIKLVLLLLVVSVGGSHANSYAQKAGLSLTLKNKSIREVFQEIEKKSDYIFFYHDEDVDLNKKVTVDIDNKTINDALNQVFADTENTYKVADRQVLITKAKPAEVTKSSQKGKITVRGNITDLGSEPLIGASIVLKGSENVVAISDVDGNYTIHVPDRYAVLQFRYLGFLDQEQVVGTRQILNVIMQEDVGQLDEVVVVGYGSQKKESVVGSISTISPGKLKGTTRSVSNSLSGQLAGVIGVQRSGEPGYDNSNFWIRGVSTFQGMRSPLVLVDGIERSLNNIDPEEIESFSVLKDASASAVYGVRGANGVILINTKRGRIGKVTITVKAEQAVTEPTKLPKFVGAADYLDVLNSIDIEAGRSPNYSAQHIQNIRDGVDYELYPDVNWMDEVLKSMGDNTRVTLDVNGGTEKIRYSFVAAFYREGGILERDKSHGWNSSLRVNRYNIRSNVDVDITPTTLMRFNIGGYLQERTAPPQSIDDIFGLAFDTPPYLHPKRYSTGAIPKVSGRGNPWSQLTQTGYERNSETKLETLFSVEQDLKMFLPGLKAKGSFSFDSFSDTSVRRHKSPDYYNPATGRDPETGALQMIVSDYGQMFLDHTVTGKFGEKSTYLEGNLTYDQTFNDDHTVNALFMYNQRSLDKGDRLPFRFQGIAARFSYTLKQRYIAEFNFGYNGSENFAKGNRFGFFPSVAAGWIVSEEEFMSGVRNTLTKLKFRGSWGLVGNDRFKIGDTEFRFPYISSIDGTDGYHWGYDRDEFHRAGRREGNIANTGLKWETVSKTNVGVEIGLWDAIDLQFDYFSEKRRDIFMRRTTMPASAGFVQMPFANFGEVDNKGIDVALNVNKKLNKDWFISAMGTFTYAKNKIIEQDEALGVIGTSRSRTGHSVDQIFGLIDNGLFTEDDFADVDNGVLKEGIPLHTYSSVRPGDIKYVDVNKDGRIDALDVTKIGGTWDPQIVYGFGVNLQYKDFDFGFFFQGNAKTERIIGRSAVFIPGAGMGALGNMFTNVGDRWTVDNPSQDVFYPRLYAGMHENNYQISTWWLKDMSMLRLKNLEIGYNFPTTLIRRINMTSARIYLRGTNLFTISDFKLWDPEIDSTEGRKYPLVRSYSIGLSVSF